MHSIQINETDANRRLDKFLFKYLNNAPHSFIYKQIRTKKIKHNGNRAQGNEILQSGDCIQLYMSEEMLGSCIKERKITEVKKIPDIVFEDENILVVNKPAGLLSHGAKKGQEDHLLARILYYLRQTGAYKEQSSFTPALCNRLDINTSGLVICGKTIHALQLINRLFTQNKIERIYLAVVQGTLRSGGVLKGFYIKDGKNNTARITNAKLLDDAKYFHAETRYEVLDKTIHYSLLRVTPVTGRSHQIRAHFASIGHPLAGDVKYGGKRVSCMPGQLLHSHQLILPDDIELPFVNEKWTAVPPEGFEKFIHNNFTRKE